MREESRPNVDVHKERQLHVAAALQRRRPVRVSTLTGVDAEVLQPQLEVGHVDGWLDVAARRRSIRCCQRQGCDLVLISGVIQGCDHTAGRHRQQHLRLLADRQHVWPQQREVVTEGLLQSSRKGKGAETKCR